MEDSPDVDIVNLTRTRISSRWLALAIRLSRARCGRKARGRRVSVALVGEARMQRLNRRWRGVGKPTDVLAFPASPAFNTPRQESSMGEIVIAVPVARRQAREHGVTLEAELVRLAVHGFLHLAGFDHEKSTRAEQAMTNVQQHILQLFAAQRYGATSTHRRH
ncbi:rRNA maturation RNase YbeY [Candidatus Parcubacteria bacterium]|nr:rRNA maturation RNase YbeY [Candidatus Parcubacteria bacterium]